MRPSNRLYQHSRVAVIAGVVALVTACKKNDVQQVVVPRTTPAIATAPARTVMPDGRSIADIAERVTPSVVTVYSERAPTQAELQQPFFSNPLFDFFFDLPLRRFREGPRRPEHALGSGVVVGADGVILTNNHVIDGADKVRVALYDGRRFDAKVVGTDPKSDLAVLRVEARDLPAFEIADSTRLRVGDLVLAIGNPFGVGQTVTMGIISAVGRANVGIADYEDFIQTDAAINPGNSGGALVDMNGRLVGINTAIVSRSGGYMGVGFAIPSSMALQIKDAILRDGKVVRGWLGVAIQDVTEELARPLELQPRIGVLVSDVTPDSPAAKAGLRRGDVIVAVDGTPTNDAGRLRNLVAFAGKGKTVTIDLVREGERRSVSVTLGEIPSDGDTSDVAPRKAVPDRGMLEGVSVRELDMETRQRLQIRADIEGVVVAEVPTTSPAAELGLRRGDVIVEVNRTPTTSVVAFRKAAAAAERELLLLVYRDGATIFLSGSR